MIGVEIHDLCVVTVRMVIVSCILVKICEFDVLEPMLKFWKFRVEKMMILCV
jgi:hypothetical protein